ncbi:hypothetical protein DFH09DRAFT_276676 [Mycena vulgaris]|nr:hypothetical protein DFH09DRAFT_276676 [Mycena vulgaris]
MQEAYRFISENYKEGDQICFFGYSRGAYMARALAGFLEMLGLLPASFSRDEFDEAWSQHLAIPKRMDVQKDEGAAAKVDIAKWRKEKGCRAVRLHFVGLWCAFSSPLS